MVIPLTIAFYLNHRRNRRLLRGLTVIYHCIIYSGFHKIVVYWDAFRDRRRFYPTTAVYSPVITLIKPALLTLLFSTSPFLFCALSISFQLSSFTAFVSSSIAYSSAFVLCLFFPHPPPSLLILPLTLF